VRPPAEVTAFVADVLRQRLPDDSAAALAVVLTDGRWTHDFPITVKVARALGLPVSVSMPRLVYNLMDLYPQAGAGRPSVLYVPMRTREPAGPVAPQPQGRQSSADR
jgi:hypothetical protein